MARTEAPKNLEVRPSLKFVQQALRSQAAQNNQVVNYDDPRRQLRILLEKLSKGSLVPETEEFEIAEPFVPPTLADLIGK